MRLLYGVLLTFAAAACSAFNPATSSCRDPRRCSAATELLADATSRCRLSSTSLAAAAAAAEGWKGDIVPGDGRIRGCTITQLQGSLTEWTIAIDGVEADSGRFSEAIYKKFIQDAKQQRFQGFRPGTIPPHLEPTYRAFAMDECARETVLEAMQQNNIRPFENCRSEMFMYNFCIPPAPASKKKKSSKKRKTVAADSATVQDLEKKDEDEPVDDGWRTFETMKEAVDAGWKPGQSFSFLAKDIKGQKVKEDTETAGATPLGVNF